MTIVTHAVHNCCWQVKVIQQRATYRTGQGVFGRPIRIAATEEMASYRWWMSFGAQTPELQYIAVRVLSQVTSAGSCETNWSPFDFIHSKKRNRLACPTVRNIVTVHCNLRLVDRIEQLGHCDDNIDWSSDGDNSEWLCFCCVLTFDSYACCYALNLNVFCCSLCNNKQILISVVFLKLRRPRPM